MKKITIENYLNSYYVHRNTCLRAAVLGANDGIISTSSLAIGVAAASSTREPVILATVAGCGRGAVYGRGRICFCKFPKILKRQISKEKNKSCSKCLRRNSKCWLRSMKKED